MKTRKSENFERLKSAVELFEKKHETILALFNTGEGCGDICVGDPADIAQGFIGLLEHGFKPDADKGMRDVVYALVFAIEKVLERGDKTAEHLGSILTYAISNAKETLDNELDDDDEEDIVEFDDDDDEEEEEEDSMPVCQDCLECKDLKKCLNDQLENLGLMVVKKPTKKEKKSDDDE